MIRLRLAPPTTADAAALPDAASPDAAPPDATGASSYALWRHPQVAAQEREIAIGFGKE